MKKNNKYKVPISYYYSPNLYGFGDFMNKLTSPGDYDKETGKYTSGAFSGWSKNGVLALTAGLPVVGNLAGTVIGGGFSSKAGTVVDSLSNIASAIPGPWGAIAGAGLKVVGGLVNRAFGAKFNDANIKEVESNIRNLRNYTSDAGSYELLTSNMLSRPTSMAFNQDFIGKNGWFNNKATRKFNKLQTALGVANSFVTNSLNNNMNNIATNQARQLASNFAELGGLLFPKKSNRYDDGGEMDDDMDKVRRLQLLEQQLQREVARKRDPYRITVPGEDSYGVIREADALRRQQYLSSINRMQDATRRHEENLLMQIPNARAQARRVENLEYIDALRRQLDASSRSTRHTPNLEYIDKEEYNKHLKRQADIRLAHPNVALPDIYVYPEDEYAKGGILTLLGNGTMSPFGKRFAKGGNAETDPAYGYKGNGDIELVYINNGGTHELNPRGGTQYGKDSKGTPNLVELGEVVIRSKDDKVPPFVVSNKVLMDEDFKKRNKLRGKTYAEGLKYANKEAIERPFNQISNNYINHISKEVMAALEKTKDREKRKQAAEQMAAYLNQASEGGLLDSYEFPLFAFGGPMNANVLELGTDYVDWINSLSDEDYINVLKSIYSKYSERDLKKYIRRYGKNRLALIDTANRGNPGTVFNGITAAYDSAKGTTSNSKGKFDWAEDNFDDWYNTMSDEDYAKLLRGAYGEDNDLYKKYIKDKEGYLKYAYENEEAGNTIKNAYLLNKGLSNPTLDEVESLAEGRKWKNPYFKNGIWDKEYYDYIQRFLLDNDDPDFLVFNPEGKYGYINEYIGKDDDESILDYNNKIEAMGTAEGADSVLSEIAVKLFLDYLKGKLKEEDNSLPPKLWGWAEGLMMVPPAVEIGLALSDRLGYTNQADESAANALNRASTTIRDIRPQFIGNKLRLLRPDPRLQENALREIAGTTIGSNMNLSGGNRGQAAANNLTSSYNYLGQLGMAGISGMQNLNDIQKAEFDANTLTDKFNAEQDLKAQVANGEALKLRMTTLAQELALRDAAWAKASGMQSANAAAALQDIYKLGVHFANRNDRDWLAEAGIFGTLPWMARRRTDQEAKIKNLEDEIVRLKGLIPEEEEEETLSLGTSNRKGGYVRTKKRKRRGITI